MKHDEELAAAMQKLAAKINDRQWLDGEIAGLKDQVIALLGEQMLAGAAAVSPTPFPKPAPKPALHSKPAIQALETIKASGPGGVPGEKIPAKSWVLALLARAQYAKKLPNGNWVAA